MSADTTEQNAANGEELRERYLPVSRKELRRRREAELAAQREAGEAPAPEEELAQDEPHVPGRPSESSSESGSTAEVGHNDEAQDELARAVSATIASESDEPLRNQEQTTTPKTPPNHVVTRPRSRATRVNHRRKCSTSKKMFQRLRCFPSLRKSQRVLKR